MFLTGRKGKPVHPIFHPSRFPSHLDYNGAFYDAIVLANRLMNSPQALQHDYCFYFGKNVPASGPENYGHARQYACNKGIGELDETDIQCVQEQRLLLADRVRFEVSELGENTLGCCAAQAPVDGVRGRNSIVHINRNVYNMMLAEGQTPELAAVNKFAMATVLLHETAHAAHFSLSGAIPEDFRETSNFAEGGFEYESRIFGQRPKFNLNQPDPRKRVAWGIWQSRNNLTGYDFSKLARNTWQIPKSSQTWTMSTKFVMKLFDEGFWEGEYLKLGAVALVPYHLAEICLTKPSNNTYKSIPLSIRDLFRDGGPSYAQKKYARFANPERKLRGPIEFDDCRRVIM